MTEKHLHIVSFDVPFPADYGGVIDVFYRLKALHEAGVKITLHCFEYGRGQQKELEKYVEKVFYYKRTKRLFQHLSREPFIIKTRSHSELLKNLMIDDAPILFEGLHTTYFLSAPELKNRIKLVRAHNIEHDYYSGLANNATDWKKWYYNMESRKLKTAEKRLEHATAIFAIKSSDQEYFTKYRVPAFVLPPFHPVYGATPLDKTHPQCLFHGNLSVEENNASAIWLINKVFIPLGKEVRFIIAGKNPSQKLKALCSETGVTLISNPTEKEMTLLVQQSRVHVFHSDQPTGVKLKLINAIQSSGHLIVNEKMVSGSGLGQYCTIVASPAEFQEAIKKSLVNELESDEIEKRRAFTQNANSCEELMPFL